MAHDTADSNGDGQDGESLRYVIGHGIDKVVGSAGDRVIVCGRVGSETAFLVEDGSNYYARTGSAAADGEILLSADGALIMSLSNVGEVTIQAAGPGDSLTVAGDFSATMLGADGLSFEGAGGIVDASAITSGHRVRVGTATCGSGERRRCRHGADEAGDAADLLIFRSVAAATDEPGPGGDGFVIACGDGAPVELADSEGREW